MEVDDLYSELGVDFQPNDRKMFLQEFTDVVRSYKSSLGPAEKNEGRNSKLEDLAAELGKDLVEFSPQPIGIPLSKKLFNELNLEIPPYISGLLKRYDFYLVNFPVTVVPKPGGGFIQLECIISFCPDLPLKERPIAYQIFPQEEWQQIIRAWQGLEIGLDENLEFKIDPIRASTKLPSFKPPVKAAIELKMAGRAGLILGPFDYAIQRSKILSKGRGNVKVHWRIEGEKYILQEEVRLGVVLQVPKDLIKIDAIGVLKALPTFHFFTTEIRNVIELMSSAGSNFFKNGAPLTNKIVWDEIAVG